MLTIFIKSFAIVMYYILSLVKIHKDVNDTAKPKRRYAKAMAKEKTTTVGYKMQLSYRDRLAKFGAPGTVSCELTKKFLIVKEVLDDMPRHSNVITSVDGSTIYLTDLGDEIYHLTIKKGSTFLVVELSNVDVANGILNFVELLNSKPNNS